MIQHESNFVFWKHHISFLLALLCAGAWAVFSLRTTIGASNVMSYLIGLMLFVVVLWTSEMLLPSKWFCKKNTELSTKTYHIIWWGTFLLFCGMVVFAFTQSYVISGGLAAMEWGINRYFIVAFLATGIGIVSCIYIKRYRNFKFSHKILNWIWCSAIVALLLFTVWWAYVPNILNYTWDYEAYWLSAFSAARGIPVSMDTTSYYGHYGMLMAPAFMLMGGFTPIRVALMLCAEGVIVTASACWVLHAVTKSYLWRFLGLFAMLDYYATLSTVEGQMTPHRVVFPMLLLALGVFYLKQKQARGKAFSIGCIIVGYVLAIFGLVWCTDSGIVGIIAWCALHFYVCFSARKLSWKDGLHLLKILASGLLCFLLAWQGTSLANQIVWNGESIDFETFMMPLSFTNFSVGTQKQEVATPIVGIDSDTDQNEVKEDLKEVLPAEDAGYIGSLQLSLVRKWTPWGLALLLFVYFVAKGFHDTSFFSSAPRFVWENGFAFFTAVMGILLLVYFFNRVYYYNMFTALFFIVVLLVLAGQNLSVHWESRKKEMKSTVYSSISTGLLLCLIVMGCFAVGRLPIQIAKIRACQDTAVMSVFFQELSDRTQSMENFRIIGPSATFCNSALQLENDKIMWRPWVNEIHAPQYPENATLILTEEAYWQIRQNRVEDTSLIDKKRYQLEKSFILNYNNRGYEESKTFYIYQPSGA